MSFDFILLFFFILLSNSIIILLFLLFFLVLITDTTYKAPRLVTEHLVKDAVPYAIVATAICGEGGDVEKWITISLMLLNIYAVFFHLFKLFSVIGSFCLKFFYFFNIDFYQLNHINLSWQLIKPTVFIVHPEKLKKLLIKGIIILSNKFVCLLI